MSCNDGHAIDSYKHSPTQRRHQERVSVVPCMWIGRLEYRAVEYQENSEKRPKCQCVCIPLDKMPFGIKAGIFVPIFKASELSRVAHLSLVASSIGLYLNNLTGSRWTY